MINEARHYLEVIFGKLYTQILNVCSICHEDIEQTTFGKLHHHELLTSKGKPKAARNVYTPGI